MYIYIHIHTCVYTHTDIHCIYIQGSGNSAKGSRGKGGLFFLRFFFEIFFLRRFWKQCERQPGQRRPFGSATCAGVSPPSAKSASSLMGISYICIIDR